MDCTSNKRSASSASLDEPAVPPTRQRLSDPSPVQVAAAKLVHDELAATLDEIKDQPEEQLYMRRAHEAEVEGPAPKTPLSVYNLISTNPLALAVLEASVRLGKADKAYRAAEEATMHVYTRENAFGLAQGRIHMRMETGEIPCEVAELALDLLKSDEEEAARRRVTLCESEFRAAEVWRAAKRELEEAIVAFEEALAKEAEAAVEEDEGEEEDTVEQNIEQEANETHLDVEEEETEEETEDGMFGPGSVPPSDDEEETEEEEDETFLAVSEDETEEDTEDEDGPSSPSSPTPVAVEMTPAPESQQDEEGHLIYEEGDVVEGELSGQRVQFTISRQDPLGKGTFGKVVEVEDANGNPFALKIISKDPELSKWAAVEMRMLYSVKQRDPKDDHCLIRLLSHFNYAGHSCLLFEKMGHSIAHYIDANNFSMMQIRAVAFQMLRALSFLHSLGVAHADLSAGNVIFCGEEHWIGARQLPRIKVIDLGTATEKVGRKDIEIGTRRYRAPELILDADWTEKVDVWSAGCLLFELYCGGTLFPMKGYSEMKHLAIAARVFGDFPPLIGMEEKTEDTFFPYGFFAWQGEDCAQNVMMKWAPLEEYKKDKKVTTNKFFDLLMIMLKVVPGRRVEAGKALEHAFFAPLKQRERDALVQPTRQPTVDSVESDSDSD